MGSYNFSKVSFMLKVFLTVAVISIPPVLLMEHSIKYQLYFFSLVFAGLIIIIIFKKDLEYRIVIPSKKIIDYVLLGCSLILLSLNVFPDVSIEIPFVLSIIISFFLSGWVITRLLDIEKSKLSLGLLVLVFCLSIGLTSIIYFGTLITETSSYLSLVFVGMACLPLINNWLRKDKNNLKIDDENKVNITVFDTLVILGLIGFFVFFLVTLYPEINDVRGRDAITHFLFTNQQILTPDNYGSVYPWFHHVWGSVLQMSSPSMSVFLTGISVLGVFLILSFFVMSREYLKKIDQRAHLLATIFFTAFTGLGWINFIQNKLSVGINENSLLLEWTLLQTVRNSSWMDVGVGHAMWLFASFRPITTAFIVIFVILYLMKKDNLSNQKFVVIMSFLGLTLSQLHLPEFILFTVFLVVLSIFLPKVKLRLKLTNISFVLSSIAFVGITYLYNGYFGSGGPQSSLQVYFILIPIVTFSAYLLTLFTQRPRINFSFNFKIVSIILIFAFVILVINWYSNIDNFSVSELRTIFAVPLEFYPVLLGIIGVFGLIGCFVVLKKYSKQPIAIFVVLLATVFVFGRLLSYLNANIIETSYFERRLIPMIFVPVSMLAPFLILKILDGKDKIPSLKKTKDLWKVVVIALIVFTGTFSTFLTFEHQIIATERNQYTLEEKELINSIQNTDPYSSLLVVTERTRNVAEAGMFGQILDAKRHKLWEWISPEMPLNAISSLDSSGIFFLTDNDKEIISKEYSDGYIGSHLVNIASYLSNGEQDSVTNLPKLSPPQSQSQTILVLPEGIEQYYYAYDFLSMGNYDYTTALIQDIETISQGKVLVTINEEIGMDLINFRNEYDLEFNKIIIFDNSGNEFSLNLEKDQNQFIENFTVLSNYENSIPFILQKNFEDFEVYYINLNPILQEINDKDVDPKKFKETYANVLSTVDENLPHYVSTERYKFRFQPEGYFTFNNLHAYGDIIFTSTSIISKIDSQINVDVDGKRNNHKEISLILPVSIDKSSSKTIEAVLEKGGGFYSKVIMNSSNLVFQGDPAIVSLIAKDGNVTKIEGQLIEIELPKSINLIRQPTVEIEGTAEFEEIVAQGALEKKLRTAGGKHNRLLDSWSQDMTVNGYANFSIKFSDDYSFVDKATFIGKKEYALPIYPYDELNNLLNFFTFSNNLE